ncbi:hypothetical protein Tco_0958032 [Tanacetum coccineum]
MEMGDGLKNFEETILQIQFWNCARKATRTGLGDASVQRPNTEAKKLQEQVYGMTQIFVGCLAFALNGNSVSLNDDEDSDHLIMIFSWFQDGQISYEEFKAI